MKIERPGVRRTMDRRVARTRMLLQDALIALIPEQGYAGITVEDICEKADVGRSTFYTHYAGKDGLRSATIDAHLQSLIDRCGVSKTARGGRLFAFSLPMLQHVRAAQALHHELFSSGCERVHAEMRGRVQRAVRNELVQQRMSSMGAPIDFAIQFVAGAFLSVLDWWITSDARLSASQVDALFQRMVNEGLHARDAQ